VASQHSTLRRAASRMGSFKRVMGNLGVIQVQWSRISDSPKGQTSSYPLMGLFN
jgi:hypothetical protein